MQCSSYPQKVRSFEVEIPFIEGTKLKFQSSGSIYSTIIKYVEIPFIEGTKLKLRIIINRQVCRWVEIPFIEGTKLKLVRSPLKVLL